MTSLRAPMLAIGAFLFAGFLFAACTMPAAPARADQQTAAAPLQKADVEKIIRDYLVAHPEVVRDAATELDRRERAAEADAQNKALADVAGQLFDTPDGVVIGNPQGKITLVEFFDYNCGYCKRALPDLGRLLTDNKDLKVILRDFPILSPSSVDAALVAGAAHKQFTGDKFWDYHRKLLGEHRLVDRDQALAVAKDMGADMAKLNDDAAAPDVRKAIQQSASLAKSLSLNGTPTYVIGDKILVGAVGYDEINKAIGNVRKCGKAMCS